MAKSVLGNDPFLRGAAPRATAPVKETPAPAPAPKTAKGKAAAGKKQPKKKRSGRAGKSQPPVSHAGSPDLLGLGSEGPVPHPSSPELLGANAAGPVAHPSSPELLGTNGSEPVPHGSSPDLIGADAPGPVPHPSSPELIGLGTDGPVPHPSSPELIGTAGSGPVSHGSSPDLLGQDGAEWTSVDEAGPGSASPLRGVAPGTQVIEGTVTRADPPRSRAHLVSVPSGGQGSLRAPALMSAVTTLGGVVRATLNSLGVVGSDRVDPFGRDEGLVDKLRPITRFFYERYWRVAVEGAELLPPGACLIVANHAGALPLDGPVLGHAIARERPELPGARWLLEDQVFHAPLLGTLMNRIGAIRASPENALRLLGENRPVIVFPEGVQGIGKPFQERYQLKRFGRGGFVKLALRAGVPIVPAAVVGAEEAMPLLAKLPGSFLGLPYLPLTPLGLLPLPSRWLIRFGEPLELGGAAIDDADDLAVVQRLTEKTREAIQGMLTGLLRARPSVF